MLNRRNNKKGFTLIELLVVVLILGILVAVALPAYLGSIKDAKLKTTNGNAKSIATALQSIYVKGGGATYVGISQAQLATELNGVPANPCSSATGWAAYTLNQTVGGATITPANDQGCDTPTVITLGTP